MQYTTATVRRKKETKWMLKLGTAFLYDLLNDKIGEEHQRDIDIPIGTSFESLKRNKKHPARSMNQTCTKNNSVKSFLSFYRKILQKDL